MKRFQKRIGRLAAALLVLALMQLALPAQTVHAEDLVIALSSKDIRIGDTLTVTVTLPAGVTGTVNLTYTQNLFTYQSASAETSVNAGTVSMTIGSYDEGNTRASGQIRFVAKAAGDGGFAASAPSAGDQEGDQVAVGAASVAVTVKNAALENAGDQAQDETSADNTLSALTLSHGTLSPAFSPDVTDYTAEVDNTETSVAVSAKTADENAVIESVNGADALAEGENTVEIVVRAQSGVTKTYTVAVTRKAAQTDETEQEGQETGYFTVDGINLYPAQTIPAQAVPDGFLQGTVTLWGTEYPCLRQSEDAGLLLLYLTDENGQGGALFAVSASDPEQICPLACVPYSQYALNAEPADTEQAESTEADGGLKTENRLLLCAFAVVVLFLLVVIVVLLVRRRADGAKENDKEDDDIKFIDL